MCGVGAVQYLGEREVSAVGGDHAWAICEVCYWSVVSFSTNQ